MLCIARAKMKCVLACSLVADAKIDSSYVFCFILTTNVKVYYFLS